MTTRLAFISSLLLLSACAQDAEPTGGARHPLGKADASGSCAAADCGGQSSGACWCDDECTMYGDCCSNVAAVCAAPQGCGGLAGLACGTGEYCKWDATQQCGAADQLGTCEPTPQICPQFVSPVCGCDGQTYGNSCFAASAGTSVSHDGACQAPANMCGGILGLACGTGEYCKYEQNQMCGAADQTGTCESTPAACPQVFQPVCGCDDVTYSNACFAAAAGTSVASTSACN